VKNQWQPLSKQFIGGYKSRPILKKMNQDAGNMSKNHRSTEEKICCHRKQRSTENKIVSNSI